MFKFLFVCALVALVAANEDPAVKELISDVLPDGFKTVLVLDNGNIAKATGDEKGNINGVYEWISPEGVSVKVSYVADENGYQPQSDLLPTPPPIPEAILKSLDWIRANPSKDLK